MFFVFIFHWSISPNTRPLTDVFLRNSDVACNDAQDVLLIGIKAITYISRAGNTPETWTGAFAQFGLPPRDKDLQMTKSNFTPSTLFSTIFTGA